MQANTSEIETQAVQLISDILSRLRSHGNVTEKDLWHLHSDNPRVHKFSIEREMFDRLITMLLRKNEAMISRRIIYERILYGIIGVGLQTRLSEAEIAQMSHLAVNNIMSFHATREVRI